MSAKQSADWMVDLLIASNTAEFSSTSIQVLKELVQERTAQSGQSSNQQLKAS